MKQVETAQVYTSQDIFIAAVRASIMKYNLSDDNPSMTSCWLDICKALDEYDQSQAATDSTIARLLNS